MNVETVPCVNCHVHTPKAKRRCIHCEKPRDIAIPVVIEVNPAYRAPTPADRAAYQEWLIKKATA